MGSLQKPRVFQTCVFSFFFGGGEKELKKVLLGEAPPQGLTYPFGKGTPFGRSLSALGIIGSTSLPGERLYRLALTLTASQ